MARRAAAAEVLEDEVPTGPVTEVITYTPGQGDPPITMWGGITFHANLPKELTGHAGGSKREQLNLEIIERARDNKHFTVGSGRKPRNKPTEIETADQYRAYFADWLKDPSIEHADQLVARFAKERELRLLCEVGGSDYDLIGALFMPRFSDLCKADELSPDQISALWRNHGFNELPW